MYGLSGDRIRLLFTGNGQLMGSELANTPVKEFLIDVAAENKLKKVELFKNGDLYKRFVPYNDLIFKKELKLTIHNPLIGTYVLPRKIIKWHGQALSGTVNFK